MKNQILLFIAVTGSLFLLSCAQESKQKYQGPKTKIVKVPENRYSGSIHEITLYVNTAEITQGTTDKYASFRQPYYITNEDYTTYVEEGDIVIWRGVSITDTLDIVNIKRIQHEAGRLLLGKNVIQGNGGEPELVVGLIKDDPDPEAMGPKEEKYKIMFEVYNNGTKRNGTFQIDPKLKIPPK